MSSRTGGWARALMAIWIALAGCAGSGGDDGVPGAGAGGIGIGGAGAGAGAIAGAGASAGASGAGAGAIAGASGAGAGAGASGAGASGAGGAGTAATFTRVWNEVLVAKGCAGEFCHGSGQGALAMNDQAEAFASLVGVAAAGPRCGTSGKMRVVAGSPDTSLLLEKMANPMPSCGDMMPLGAKLEPNCISPDPSVCTTQTEIQLVRAWITAGAAND